MTMLEGRNLWELLSRRVETSGGDRLAVDDDGHTLTFADLRDRAEIAAAGLAAMGVGEGDVVSWQLPTWFESMVLVAALARLGAIQNPILPIYRQREVGFVCRQAGSALLVVPGQWRGFDYEDMASTIAAGQPGLEVLVASRALPEGDPAALPPPPSADGPLPVRWYFYTSGTTSDPKGARHTDASVAAEAVAMCERLEVTESDRLAVVFPFTHIGGIGYLFDALLTGCSLIFTEAFDPQATPELLRANDVTLAGAGTPFFMAYLNYHRTHEDMAPLFPHVRAFIGGGAPKPPQLHYDIKGEMGSVGIVSGYGLTEAPIVTMGSVRDSDEELANTEGRPSPGVDLVIVALDGSRAAAGAEGEIRVKGPQLMQGYLDASLDAEAFDDDGYFRTGDLGRLDEHGNVVITGRVKDIIIRNMENISAKEVEDLLFTHPKIADVAVIGLPDPRTGERACAVVVLAPEAAADPPTLADLGQFLLEHGLSKHKLPEQLEFVDALPRNPTGKIVKFELRDRFKG
jgi:acyl-CoA synthetase (AMP-forming)/AMP-acid ligase II